MMFVPKKTAGIVLSAIVGCLLFAGCGSQPLIGGGANATTVAESSPEQEVAVSSTEVATPTPPAPPKDACANIPGRQDAPPPGLEPGLSPDNVNDDCWTHDEWVVIWNKPYVEWAAAKDAWFAGLESQINGLVEAEQGKVPADQKWSAAIYLNVAVKFACGNQKVPGAAEKAGYMYDANWPNWIPAAGDHLYDVSFDNELASYGHGCSSTNIEVLYPEPTQPTVPPKGS